MLKTVLKLLAYYLLLTLLVSGCSLIGEYAEGINGTPNGTAHTVPSAEVERSKSITESGTLKQTRVVFDTHTESNPIKVSSTPIEKQSKQYAKVDTLYMLMPFDTLQRAFDELRKRRKFYISKRKCWRCRKYEFT